MNNLLRLLLSVMIASQGAFVRADISEPKKPGIEDPDSPSDKEDSSATPETPDLKDGTVECLHCISIDKIKGDTVQINGKDFILDHIMYEGMWYLMPVPENKGNQSPETWDGLSADETFGKDGLSAPNTERVRWMNAGYGPLDEKLDGKNWLGQAKYSDGVKNQTRGQIYANTEQESLKVLEAINQGLVNSTDTKNSFICPASNCSSTLSKLASTSLKGGVGSSDTAAGFMRDFYEGLPGASPYVTDQVGMSGRYIDSAPYSSPHKNDLDKQRDRLNHYASRGPQQWEAKKESYRYLRGADDAYLASDNETGDLYFKAAVFTADIATDFIPWIQIPKDTFKALVGIDPVNGEKLSTFERSLAAGFAVLSGGIVLAAGGTVALGGVAVIGGVEAVAKLVKATAKEAKLGEKLAEVIAKSPLKVEVLLKGTVDEFTIIGRDMTRVNEVAGALEKQGIKVNTFQKFSREANEEWGRLLIEYAGSPGGRIPSEVVKTTIRYAENEVWLDKAIKAGSHIIDTGNPMGAIMDFSAFYEMEKNLVLQVVKGLPK